MGTQEKEVMESSEERGYSQLGESRARRQSLTQHKGNEMVCHMDGGRRILGITGADDDGAIVKSHVANRANQGVMHGESWLGAVPF